MIGSVLDMAASSARCARPAVDEPAHRQPVAARGPPWRTCGRRHASGSA